MIKELKEWLRLHKLIIKTKIEYDASIMSAYFDGVEVGSYSSRKSTWSAINPIIHDLEKLRANTWDQDKITHIQEWLRNNFEVEK